MEKLKEIFLYKELIQNLTVRNIKIRYKNSFLGFFWTLLNPIIFIMIYYFFIKLMRFQMDLSGLLAGILPWHFLSMTLSDNVECITGNSTLITKVRFPRIILPLSTAFADLMNYVLSLLVLIVFLPVLGTAFSFKILLLLPLIILTFIFVFGFSLLLATCNVYFKDTSHILSVSLMAWFFMTPIIYPLTQIPERFRDIIYINPMASLIAMYRYILTGASFTFNLWVWAGITLIFIVFMTGIKMFYKYEAVFADEL